MQVASLKQNTPNTFNALTVISYYLPPSNNTAVIEMVSASGQLLKTFQLAQKGNSQLRIDGTAFPSGTYSCILKVNGAKVDSKQMLLVK